MRKIRVNTGIDFLWTLYLGENTVDWAYYDLTLEMTKPSHAKEIIDYTVEGSVLKFNYKPNQCGQYIISAYLNRYKTDETILDNKVFEAVRWSWNTTDENDNLAATTLELEGNIEVVNSGPKIDISNYYTKEEVNAIVEGVVKVENLESYNFATESWVTANYQPKGNYQPAGNYQPVGNYVTEEKLEERLENIEVNIPDIDLSKYVTSEELDGKGYLTYIPTEYVTEQELDGKGYLTYIPSEYVTEQELDSRRFVTTEYLQSKNYVTQGDLQFGDFNLDGYYTKYESDEMFVKKGEVNMDEYATKYQVALKQDNLVSGQNIKTINGESILGEGDITFKQYDEKQDALVSGINIKTINGIDILGEGDIIITGSDAPDMTGYVTTTELNNRGYISEIPDEYITESELEERKYATIESVEAKQERLVTGQNIKTINGKSLLGGGNLVISGNADLSDYYTKPEIDDIVSNIDVENVDLTGYATEAWVTDKYVNKSAYSVDWLSHELSTNSKLDSVKIEMQSWVTDQGYLSEVPSNYVTETELEDRLATINIEPTDEIPTLTIHFETGEYNDRFLVETIFQRLLNNKPCNIILYRNEVNGETGQAYSITGLNSYQFNEDNTVCVLSFDAIGESWYTATIFREASLDTPSTEHYKRAQISIYTEAWRNSINTLNNQFTTLQSNFSNLETTVESKVAGYGITSIKKMTQAEYDAITPEDTTLYIIVG